jgi:hypothetical protein
MDNPDMSALGISPNNRMSMRLPDDEGEMNVLSTPTPTRTRRPSTSKSSISGTQKKIGDVVVGTVNTVVGTVDKAKETLHNTDDTLRRSIRWTQEIAQYVSDCIRNRNESPDDLKEETPGESSKQSSRWFSWMRGENN